MRIGPVVQRQRVTQQALALATPIEQYEMKSDAEKHTALDLEIDLSCAGYLEELQAQLDRGRASNPRWRQFFSQLDDERTSGRASRPLRDTSSLFRPRSLSRGIAADGASTRGAAASDRVPSAAVQLAEAYRARGHLVADVNPLEDPPALLWELDPETYGLSGEDFDRQVELTYAGERKPRRLGAIVERLQRAYCDTVAVELGHIRDASVRRWVETRTEQQAESSNLDAPEQRRILEALTKAEVFEEFTRKKYISAKTYSLSGAESLIPLLRTAIEVASEQDIDEIVVGMAHRGRLNALANVLNRDPKETFARFEHEPEDVQQVHGDVRHHLGHSSDVTLESGKQVHVSLCFNPSHLEFVNPVAMGRMRAKQDRFEDAERRRGMTLLVHGDAGCAGEGIVQEAVNLSELPGYTVGGSLHVVLNNQLGFTTPPAEGRSSRYATDIARMLDVPIFHVNGDDPEAVVRTVKMAMEFRREFGRDVWIDLLCYRRLGHNEHDEPSFTQPLLYKQIEEHPSIREVYLQRLVEQEIVSQEEAKRLAGEEYERLKQAQSAAEEEQLDGLDEPFHGIWQGYTGGPEPDGKDEPETGVQREQLASILQALTEMPEGFHQHDKLEKSIKARRSMAEGEQPVDWSAAEALAIGSLAAEGYPVRLSGQDSERGTFTQRHGVLHDTKDDTTYVPLAQVAENQAPVEILNTPLCEAGALGFEYGYSLDGPGGLVIWEAQFGDFVNAAQVMIDQFITSAEDKWRRLTGLVLLLPHGFEGQGPEHSSARPERFLTLAAEDNLQLVHPTTPAQFFHCLRRQVLRAWRKPLVVLSPKSLLRHPAAVSDLDEFESGRFARVLPDPRSAKESPIRRILLCSVKLYYELDKAREEQDCDDAAIIRLEQLYPFPIEELRGVLDNYHSDIPVCWVQEEPENMGPWRFLWARVGPRLLDRFDLQCIARPESASPASGSSAAHKQLQSALIERAFDAGES